MGKGSSDKADQMLTQQQGLTQRLVGMAEKQQKMGEEAWKQTAPARDYTLNTYMGLAKGNVPGIEKYTAPQINAATQQFYLARKQAEALPPGAARDSALRDLRLHEASAKTGIYSGGYSDALTKAGGIGWGGTNIATGLAGQAMGGMGGAVDAYSNAAQMYEQQASSKGAMAGSGMAAAGSVAGALL